MKNPREILRQGITIRRFQVQLSLSRGSSIKSYSAGTFRVNMPYMFADLGILAESLGWWTYKIAEQILDRKKVSVLQHRAARWGFRLEQMLPRGKKINWWGDPDDDSSLSARPMTGNRTHGMVLLPGHAPNSTSHHQQRRARKAEPDDDIEKPAWSRT